MSRTNLNFHMTFRPERQYISSLLNESSDCNEKNIEEISNITGIPTGKSSGKVEPTLCYAEYMGLINKLKKDGAFIIERTSLGNAIAEEDSGLLEKLTLLLLHAMLNRPYSGAELWAYIFNEVFPKYRNKLTVKQFNKEIELQFGVNTKLAPFNGTYQDLFSSLNLIELTDDDITLKPSKIDSDYVYLYALVLFSYWDEWLENIDDEESMMVSDSEVTAKHLDSVGFRKPFGWSEKEEYEVLEMLSAKKLISLNRQMVPFSIRRCVDEEYLIEMLYSELC